MKLRLRCSCGQEMLASLEVAGAQVRCVGCQSVILVPVPENALRSDSLQSDSLQLGSPTTGSLQPNSPQPESNVSSASGPVVAQTLASSSQASGSISARPVASPEASAAPAMAARPIETLSDPLSDLPLPDPLDAFATSGYGTAATAGQRKTGPGSGNHWKLLAGITGGVLGLLALGGIASVLFNGGGRSQLGTEESYLDQLDLASASEGSLPPKRSSQSAVPRSRGLGLGMPGRPTFRPLPGSRVSFGSAKFDQPGPGGKMEMNIYMPPGTYPGGALGCVLVAPAGTNLLVGNSVDGADYHDETLPYAEAGFVVIQYSLDGDIDMEHATEEQFSEAFREFRMAMAGARNTSLAMRYATEVLEEVDPRRIFVAGHSSAGTVALNSTYFAPGIAGCAAFAPCSDPEAFHADLYSVPGLNSIFPGMRGFDRMNSPMANASRIRCPIFVFQASADGVVDCNETRTFVEKVKKTNRQVKYVEVVGGDHYNSMIQQGIPAAVRWFKELDSSLAH